MEVRRRAEKVPGEAVRRSQFENSNYASSATVRTENSWQQEAALFLLRSGFRPGGTTGQVHHIASPHTGGRTFGSVWHAMRSLIESEPERFARPAQDENHTRPLQ